MRTGRPRGAQHSRRILGVLDAGAYGTPAAARVEGRELVGREAENRDGEALQSLEGEAEVEDDLGARAKNRDRRTRDLFQVGGLVLGMASVHAADAAGGEEADAGEGGRAHRGRDRR